MAAVKCGLHMAKITIAMRHSQGVTIQYIALSLAERAAFITQLTVASCEEEAEDERAEDESEGIVPISLIHTNLFHGTLMSGIP